MLLSVRRGLLALLFSLFCLMARADYNVNFTPVDSITRLNLRKCEALVFLPGDSVLVTEGHFINVSIQGDLKTYRRMSVNLPKSDTEYHIMIDAEGYDTRLLSVKVPKSFTEWQIYNLGDVGVKRTPKMLNEVTVEATKIRMYYKGDTLIYNADAFMMPDGSMLDDLIRKLDGVTINEYGEIFCNGRKVRSLQLHGRELFEGNPKTLLENLGAYTVSKIKVYDYKSAQEKFLGYSETGAAERELVMDVNLKKEYSIGKWANIDGGYGTHNRYLGRGFLLGFSPTWAVSAVFNANNLGTGDNPGRHSRWNMKDAGKKEATYLSGGISYQNDWKRGEKTRQIRGSVNVNSSKETSRRGGEDVRYYSTGDVFSNYYENSRSRDFSVRTNHTMQMQPSRVVWFSVSPSFTYSNAHNRSNSTSASFNEYLGRVTAEEIEAIYSRDPEMMARHVINRQLTQSKNNTSRIHTGLTSSTILRLPDLRDGSVKQNLTIDAGGSYNRSQEDGFSLSTINYGAEPTPAYQLYDYSRRHPAHSYHANGSANYAMNIMGRGNVSVKYVYNHNEGRTTYARYMLNELSETELGSFGELPTNEAALAQVLDLQNSNQVLNWSNEHAVYVNSNANFGERDFDKGGHGAIYLAVNPSVRFMDNNLHYTKHDYDTIAARKSILPAINGYLNLFADRGKKEHAYSLSLRWRSGLTPVDVYRLINVPNTADPLYITRGNSHLKETASHFGSAEFQFRASGNLKHVERLRYEYNFSRNSVVNGVRYFPETGVRITQPYNVNGNYEQALIYEGNGDIYRNIDRYFTYLGYSLSCRGSERRTMNMQSSTNETPTLTGVYRHSLVPSVTMNFNFKDFNFSLGTNGNWSRYTGDASFYTAFTSTDWTYRFSGSVKLPKEIWLNTNFNVYTRSGYKDSALNSTEYIWNISASWYWKKTGLTFIADAYDLLHQIKNVSYYADHLGRTESWSNTLPRYALLRIQYHLDLSPK